MFNPNKLAVENNKKGITAEQFRAAFKRAEAVAKQRAAAEMERRRKEAEEKAREAEVAAASETPVIEVSTPVVESEPIEFNIEDLKAYLVNTLKIDISDIPTEVWPKTKAELDEMMQLFNEAEKPAAEEMPAVDEVAPVAESVEPVVEETPKEEESSKEEIKDEQPIAPIEPVVEAAPVVEETTSEDKKEEPEVISESAEQETANKLNQFGVPHNLARDMGIESLNLISEKLKSKSNVTIEDVAALDPEIQKLLRAHLEKYPHTKVRGGITYMEMKDSSGIDFNSFKLPYAEKLEYMKKKYPKGYPIMSSEYPNAYFIKWDTILPYEIYAWSNHGQTLETMLRRGGAGFQEILAIMSGVEPKHFSFTSDKDALEWFRQNNMLEQPEVGDKAIAEEIERNKFDVEYAVRDIEAEIKNLLANVIKGQPIKLSSLHIDAGVLNWHINAQFEGVGLKGLAVGSPHIFAIIDNQDDTIAVDPKSLKIDANSLVKSKIPLDQLNSLGDKLKEYLEGKLGKKIARIKLKSDTLAVKFA